MELQDFGGGGALSPRTGGPCCTGPSAQVHTVEETVLDSVGSLADGAEGDKAHRGTILGTEWQFY